MLKSVSKVYLILLLERKAQTLKQVSLWGIKLSPQFQVAVSF